ncbi:right-handed parallel beta-helix repeat-containing protein [Microlunatus speluncae]|uniref:right-handed parallel beta-helix repeat-containing protein n=1 Tax=Microlunatus speluncae TaxID=2594267 RepID=UPI0012665546|nr:right-handed parallel beta-helix repeat-containing protein [Microlunatus speluncae]
MLLRRWALVFVLFVVAATSSCGQPEVEVRPPGDGPVTIAVPGNAPTIQQAADAAKPGDTIEVSPGTYGESVSLKTADVTLRGTDRNAVIIDGGGLRGNGVVVTAPRVTVANLTVRGFNLNGVLITGLVDENGGLASGSDGYRRLDPKKFPPLQGFAVRHVTASNNALYGIYAFDSQNGVIENNYASGHGDSGIYVGQCDDCNIVVRNNVAEYNAVGYQQANASNVVSVVRNRFSDNRVGMTLLSDYQEAYVPQRKALVAGNLIADNDAEKTPAQSDGAFGIGLGISGGQDNEITRNLITGNPTAGIVISSSEDIAPLDNRLAGNVAEDNEIDLAYVATERAPGAGNCLDDNEFTSSLPVGLNHAWACPQGGVKTAGEKWNQPSAPGGISFRDVRQPPPQPQLPESARTIAPEPPKITDKDTALPDDDLWSELTHDG